MAQLTLLLMGPPQIERNGTPIRVDTRKAIALLAYLAVTRQIHSRDSLALMFWPDTAEARARLRRTLSVLNAALARSWLDIERETISLEWSAGLWLDVEQFHRLLAVGRSHGHPPDVVCPACIPSLSDAAALYRDEFMAGFSLRDSQAFDDWQLFQREHLRSEMTTVLEKLVRAYAGMGQFEQAAATARRWLTLEPLDESAHQSLMLVLVRSGQRAAALRQYEECTRLLEEQLAVSPAPELTLLYEQIRDGSVDLGGSLDARLGLTDTPITVQAKATAFSGSGLLDPASKAESPERAFGYAAAWPVSPSTLPPQATPFIGRDREITEIITLLTGADCRLLTLTGVGGIGKTRLALHAAAAMQPHFAGHVYFIPLEGVSSPDLLPAAIASGLGLVSPNQGITRPQLLDVLKEQSGLLLLDNFEHLLEAGTTWVAEMLSHTTRLKFLVTSRERLNLRGEWLLPVAGMSFPDPSDTTSLETFNAVQLFCQRAAAIQPHFSPNPADLAKIADICRLLVGMPLAIELAAAWTPLLSCTEIAQEIGRNLDFLTTTLRDTPARHQSLRAVLDSSWHRLSQPEQAVLTRLSIFQGGFTRPAAEKVAEAALPVLLMLLSKSFLQRHSNDRYTIHPLLQQYTQEKLKSDPEAAAATNRRHAHYYSQWLAQSQATLYRRESLSDLLADVDNIRLAWQWAIEQRDEIALGPMAAPLYEFYDGQSWYQEGEQAFALAEQSARTGVLAMRLKARRAALAYRLGRLDESRAWLHIALTFLQTSEPDESTRLETAFINKTLGKIAYNGGNYPEAEEKHRQALALYIAAEDETGIAQSWHNLGLVVSSLGRLLEAQKYYEDSLALGREIGNLAGVALTLNNLGSVKYTLGEPAAAATHYQESLHLARQIGNHYTAGLALNNLGLLAADAGEHAQALTWYEAGLEQFQATGYRSGVAGILLNLGQIELSQGKIEAARGRFQTAQTIFNQIGEPGGLTLCWDNLGHIAEKEGDITAATAYFQQSLTLNRQLGDTREVALNLINLGRTSLTLNERSLAWNCLQEALQIGITLQAMPILLAATPPLVTLLAQSGHHSQALALAQAASRHPALEHGIAEQLAMFLENMGQRGIRDAAADSSPEITLKKIITTLLQESP
ncbi:MAG: tetratricopeptide repeat protein [Anaerolineae bacterium]|nr:tetratricopeptide repeat protein [Anaerolineae bacterium]